MKPSNVLKAVKFLVTKQRPAFLWGSPGIYKSSVMAQAAAELKLELRDVRMSLLDPMDLKGFPTPSKVGTKGVMSWLPPDFLPTKGKGILFMDELNLAPAATQAAGYQLILDRRIGDYHLPAGWSVMAAGNRASDRSGVHAMPAALANRLIHIDCEVDADDWNRWAVKSGISDGTRAYLRYRPNNLCTTSIPIGARAYPTPRSWAFADQIVNSGLDADVELEMLRGTVGEGAAAEYIGFLRETARLPNIDQIMLDPSKVPVPESLSTCHAVVSALEARTTTNNFARVMDYITRMDKEFEVLFVKSVISANDELATTKTFVTWTEANSDILFG